MRARAPNPPRPSNGWVFARAIQAQCARRGFILSRETQPHEDDILPGIGGDVTTTDNPKGRAQTRVFVANSLVAAVLAVVGLHAANAWAADGNQLYAFSALQKSMGGAGVASPQDATWAIMNPATLVDLDRRLDFSLETLYVRLSSEPKGSILASSPFAGEMNAHALVGIPSFGMVWPLEHLTLGAAVIGVAGNKTDYPHPRATLALFNNADRRATQELAKIPLVISHRFDNGWALGFAVVPSFMKFRTDSLTLKLHTTDGANRYDNVYGCGFEFGLYRNWDKWAVGACYTTRNCMQKLPKYENDLSPWSLDSPQQFQIGAAYRPVKALEFVADYKWIDWNDVNLFGNQTIKGGLVWKEQHIFKGGVSWHVNDRWTVRSGVSLGNPAVTSDAIFANTLTPAMGKTHFALGFSHQLSDCSSVHVTYSQTLPEKHTDNGKGDLFSILGKGTMASFEEYSLTMEYSRTF